jgi:hypothetical protein
MDIHPIDTGRRRRRRWFTAAAATAFVASLAACGGDDDAAADVASIDTETSTPTDNTTADDTTTGEVDPEEAFLAYTECMREHGIDMPDPQVVRDDGTGGGGILVQSEDEAGEGDGPRLDPESEEFQAAEGECSPILEDAIGEIEIDPEREAEMREQMLAFSECMREHGIDYPDPVFDDSGRVEMRIEGGDPNSDEWREAEEACAEDGGMFGRPAIAAAEGE